MRMYVHLLIYSIYYGYWMIT